VTAPRNGHDPVAAGVDGCRGGWVGAGRLPDGVITVRTFERFASLLTCWPNAVVAIDIPIGLAACGPRASDRLARLRLGPRRASVFPPPPRAALHARTYLEACALRRSIEGKAVSKEAWGIFAKIAEVDAIVAPELQESLIEAHPELCFATMNGGRPLVNGKKTTAGRLERVELLRRCLPGSDANFDAPRPRGCAPDDLLDCLAVLWTAERYRRGEAARLPPVEERDDRGLRMEIWY
jgi:predicted RNase H-like nuclease